MIEVKIEAIRVNLIGSHRVIILKELSSERYLPIWIGQAEADSITIQLTETKVARPLTHDLVLAMIEKMSASVQYIVVNDMQNDTFYAQVALKPASGGKDIMIDSRPSDAIALAVRARCPIYIEAAIMDEHGHIPEETATAATVADEDLGAFKDFLGSLDLDDLEKK
jgi:hypothetical protein